MLGKKNHAIILYSLLKREEVFSTTVWQSVIINNHQRVMVYANQLFNIASQTSNVIGLSKGPLNSPSGKKIGVTIEEYFVSGGLRISMFALAEQICRVKHLSPISHLICQKLIPIDVSNSTELDKRH